MQRVIGLPPGLQVTRLLPQPERPWWSPGRKSRCRFSQQLSRHTYHRVPDAQQSPGVARCSSRELSSDLFADAAFPDGFLRLPTTIANGSVAAIKYDVGPDRRKISMQRSYAWTKLSYTLTTS